jgi:hypothetical protein
MAAGALFAGFDNAVCAAALVAKHDDSEIALLNP